MPQLQKDCMPLDCRHAMQEAGVVGAVAVQARTVVQETDFLLQLAESHSQIWGVVGWADLADPDLQAHLERWTAHPAMCGIRHILQDEVDVKGWLDNPDHSSGLLRVQRAGLAYDVLVFDHQMAGLASFCAKHDAHWLVLDHVGKPSIKDWQTQSERALLWKNSVRDLAALPHVACKLSGLVTEADWKSGQGIHANEKAIIWACFDHALEAFGPQRLMFGSDWPVCQLAAPYGAVHDLVEQWAQQRLSAEEQQALWFGNAIRCYRLNVPSVFE